MFAASEALAYGMHIEFRLRREMQIVMIVGLIQLFGELWRLTTEDKSSMQRGCLETSISWWSGALRR